MIELEHIVNGDKFRKQLLERSASKGLVLKEKHEGLCEDCMPEIESLKEKGSHLEIAVSCDSKGYTIQVEKQSSDVVRAGLAMAFGYGLVGHDYELASFDGVELEDLKLYAHLAVEVWERNIHVDWMHKCGYKTHNGTKDEMFFYNMLYNRIKAVEQHHERSEAGEKGDTPHHVFSDGNLLRQVLLSKGEHPLSKYLVESIYDQATATSRIWYFRRNKPFEERLIENRDEGYYINAITRWKPGFFGFRNSYETEIWQTWLKAHEEFKDYWINKFGKNEELWQPPAPKELLE